LQRLIAFGMSSQSRGCYLKMGLKEQAGTEVRCWVWCAGLGKVFLGQRLILLFAQY
jgi:hypothetical protein